jgi:hypothetical protein
MPEHPQFTPLTLRSYSEALRRELYDAVVQHLWTPDDHGDYVPAFTPDAAQLTVMYSHGRWIVVYIDLEEPVHAPPDQRACPASLPILTAAPAFSSRRSES